MDKIIATACAVIALAATPAHATDYFTDADMQVFAAPDGSYSVSFGRVGLPSGTFDHVWEFTLPLNGLASGSITTSVINMAFYHTSVDTDFTSVTFNGQPLTGTFNAINESAVANSVVIFGGALNKIIIQGIARGNGSYSAQGVYVPTVPEPASWALMLTGIGLVGAAMRRRAPRVAFA